MLPPCIFWFRNLHTFHNVLCDVRRGAVGVCDVLLFLCMGFDGLP